MMKRFYVGLGLACALLWATPAFAQAPTFYVTCSATLSVTAAADLLHVEADSTHPVSMWRVWLVPGVQTTAGYHVIVLRRTTTASTGGSTVTAAPLDPNAAAFGGVTRYSASGGGTDGVTLLVDAVYIAAATGVNQGGVVPIFDAVSSNQPITINAGGTTGIEVHDNTGGTGASGMFACVLFSVQQ